MRNRVGVELLGQTAADADPMQLGATPIEQRAGNVCIRMTGRQAIVDEAKKNEYRVKDIVRAVALSELIQKR